jgi:Bacterial PH domain
MVTVGSSQHGGVGIVVLGTLALLFSAWLGSVLATNRLITAAGLVYWNNLRKRHIGWSEIQSFGVGSGRSYMRWPCLVTHLDSGSVTVTSVSSFTTTYPARVADELSALRRELAAGSPAGADRPEGESS